MALVLVKDLQKENALAAAKKSTKQAAADSDEMEEDEAPVGDASDVEEDIDLRKQGKTMKRLMNNFSKN